MRYYKDGYRLIKKRPGREGLGDDGDIKVSLSIDRARQASELATISQQYADDTALETASRLSITSQLATSIAQQLSSSTTTTNELTALSSEANQGVNTISAYSDSVTSLGRYIAYWPLYIDEDYSYANRYRDISYNAIDLVVSGTETPETGFGLSGDYVFRNIAHTYSGLYIASHSAFDTEPFLINDSTDDIAKLTINSTEPFSIEFLFYYIADSPDDGYIVDFGDQYQVRLDTSNNDLKLYVGGTASTATIPLDTNAWQHIVISYDPSARVAYFYKNGIFVASDSNVGIPGDVPTDNLIRIMNGVGGGLNDLKIYKATLSNSSAHNNFKIYWSRYFDFDTGSFYLSNDAGGDFTKLVEPETGIVRGVNVSRHLLSNAFYAGSNTSPVAYVGTSYQLDGGTGHSAYRFEDNYIKVDYVGVAGFKRTIAGVPYRKLKGEDYVVWTASWTLDDAVDPVGSDIIFELYAMPAVPSGVAYTEPIIVSSGTYTWASTNSGVHSLGLDTSSLVDSSFYTIGVRSTMGQSGEQGVIHYFSLDAGSAVFGEGLDGAVPLPPPY